MADKNIDQTIRKPRRTKGTPFYSQRNYYALGVIAISGATWIGYEYVVSTYKLINYVFFTRQNLQVLVANAQIETRY